MVSMAKGQKRGNGEGTAPTKRKDGRWWCRYTVHTLSGSRRKAVYGKTRQEAAKKLAKALAERDGGLAFNPESITLAAFLERWLNLSIKQNVAKSTYTRYERSVRLKLSHLGPVQVNKLTVGHVEGLRNTLLQRGDAPASVAFDLTVLSIAMNTAIRWGLAQLNPTRGVTRPKDREQKMHALSESEAASLIEVVRETR
jgi:integrase